MAGQAQPLRPRTPVAVATQDLSSRAVSRAVFTRSLQQPHVLYPVAVGLLGGLAVALLGPSLLFVAPAVLGGVLGLGGWAFDYGLRKHRHAADYLQRVHAALAERLGQAIAELSREFADLGFEPGLQQLRNLQTRFEAFDTLLRRKLNPAEMTFGRYQSMTEQVYLAGLDNLRRVADGQRGLQSIDVQQVQSRIIELDGDGIASRGQDQEIAALQQRLALRAERQEKIFGWLAENQQAITQIDRVMAAIADMDTATGHAQTRMEDAMQELGRLSERARDYGSDAGS